MHHVSPYIDSPTIPEGMTCAQYRINRPRLRPHPKLSGVRRLLRARLR